MIDTDIIENEIRPEESDRREGPQRGLGEAFLEGVATFFYDIFNPLLVPAYATLLIFELSILSVIAPGAALPYVLTVFGATCFLPVLLLLLFRRMGIISSLTLDKRSDRIYPYLLEFLVMGGMTLFFIYKGAPSWVWLVYLGATSTILVNWIINIKFKISNHASALAGMVAVFLVIQNDGMPHFTIGWWTIGTLLVAGVCGSAAVLLKRHTPAEVFAGYVTGFLGVYLFSLIA